MIELKNINKIFKDESSKISFQALYDINIKIDKPGIVGIIGPSGSGKSTLLNIIGLIDNYTNGNYIYNNQDIIKLNEYKKTILRRKEFGFIFQHFNLIDVITAYENIAFTLELNNCINKNKIMDLMEKLGIKDCANRLPKNISGGQKQRVAIARALIHNPNLIIADEPTAALDTKTALSVMESMQSIAEQFKCIILISTHDSRIFKYCYRIITLEDGKIAKDTLQ